MQNRPNQVQTCTQASRLMVSGIWAIAERISRAPARRPAFSLCPRRKASRSSGGYSFVLTMVQRTAPRKATAPR
jgi:hypothetical protein